MHELRILGYHIDFFRHENYHKHFNLRPLDNYSHISNLKFDENKLVQNDIMIEKK